MSTIPALEPLEQRHLPSFVAPLSYDVGRQPYDVAAGDLNGDGAPDLVAVNSQGNSVSVLLGNGDGTFQNPRTFPAGGGARSVAIALLDDDPFPDVVVSSFGGVTMLLGNGDGSLRDRRTFPAASAPDVVAVADFNLDGNSDIVVVNRAMSGAVLVLLGDGRGSFDPPLASTTGSYPLALAVADFNGDGVSDLATAEFNDTASVLLGNGDGTFTDIGRLAVGRRPSAVAADDFNDDGAPDLAVGNADDDSVSVLLGNGDGSFADARSVRVFGEPSAITPGDFTGDGVTDLAVVLDALDNAVLVLQGTGDGFFVATPVRAFVGFAPAGAAAADFNGDGLLDLAVANILSHDVSILLGDPAGGFAAPPSLPVRGRPDFVTEGDFDNNGCLDLVTHNFSGASLLLSNCDGTFQNARAIDTDVFNRALAVGDFNGDGWLDLAVANDSRPNGTVSVSHGNGDGTFQRRQEFRTGRDPRFVAVGDFDGDGLLDLVTADAADNTVSFLRNLGDGTFDAPVAVPVGRRPSALTVGDFDGDGLLDLAVSNWEDSNVGVLLGTGSYRTFAVGRNPAHVTTADVNHDGILDLVTANINDNTASVLLGIGGGTFQVARNFPALSYANSVAIADYNLDGNLDLAVAGSFGVRVLLGTGTGNFASVAFTYRAGDTVRWVTALDFNGDFYPDLAVANSYSDDVSLLFNAADWGSSPVPGGDDRDWGATVAALSVRDASQRGLWPQPNS